MTVITFSFGDGEKLFYKKKKSHKFRKHIQLLKYSLINILHKTTFTASIKS